MGFDFMADIVVIAGMGTTFTVAVTELTVYIHGLNICPNAAL